MESNNEQQFRLKNSSSRRHIVFIFPVLYFKEVDDLYATFHGAIRHDHIVLPPAIAKRRAGVIIDLM